MQEPNQSDYLSNLRQQIIHELGPLITDSQLGPEDRFNFYISIAGTSENQDDLSKAFEAAKQIESTELKVASMMRLLELVSDLQASANVDETIPAEGSAEQPDEQQIVASQEQNA